MARSRRSISFKKREEADEIFAFPLYYNPATFQQKNSVVMVEYQDDDQVLIIAGNLPGMTNYYENHSFDGDEKRIAQHELANELLDNCLEFLSEYDPETSTSKANSGNRSMNDIHVTVDEDQRDEVVNDMWKVLLYLRRKHIEFLDEWEPQDYFRLPSLDDEVLRINHGTDLPDRDI
jgi:hypothetical protein